jgi:hypothetical protein
LRLLKPKRARAGKEESGIGLVISRAIVAAVGIGIGWKGPSRRAIVEVRAGNYYNLKMAKALGLTVPPLTDRLITRTDEVIE